MFTSLINRIIIHYLRPPENYIYGFAVLKGLLTEKFNGYDYGISIGRRLDDPIIEGIRKAPTPEYLDHYTKINNELLCISEQIAQELNSSGIQALPIKPTVTTGPDEFDQSMPDLRYDVSHKMVATRAGLGWIGKTDLFISKRFGARLRLTSILINKDVRPVSKPVDKSRCGTCNICVEKCPAKAATGRLWDIHTDRDIFFNAFKCREKCSEFGRTYLNIDKRICGICVAVCPIKALKSVFQAPDTESI